MRWRKVKEDLIESDVKYKILKCTSHGVPTGRYIAFLPRVGDRPAVLGGFDSSVEAKRKCEQHALGST